MTQPRITLSDEMVARLRDEIQAITILRVGDEWVRSMLERVGGERRSGDRRKPAASPVDSGLHHPDKASPAVDEEVLRKRGEEAAERARARLERSLDHIEELSRRVSASPAVETGEGGVEPNWTNEVHVTGYMCLTDFTDELGAAAGGNTVYPSIGDLKENRPCVDECGIAEVRVTGLRIVQPFRRASDRNGEVKVSGDTGNTLKDLNKTSPSVTPKAAVETCGGGVKKDRLHRRASDTQCMWTPHGRRDQPATPKGIDTANTGTGQEGPNPKDNPPIHVSDGMMRRGHDIHSELTGCSLNFSTLKHIYLAMESKRLEEQGE